MNKQASKRGALVSARFPTHGHGDVDVMHAIPSEYRNAILQQCTRKHFRKGATVWAQGDIADSVAFLARGKAVSVYRDARGRQGATGFWLAGDMLGGWLISGSDEKRQVTLKCLEDATIYFLDLAKFHEIIGRFPGVALAIIKGLSLRLRWVTQLLHVLQTQTAFSKVCIVLLSCAERFPIDVAEGILIDLEITHADLAAIIGVSRQFMTTTLHKLEKQGLISVKRCKITVTNMQALRKLVAAR